MTPRSTQYYSIKQSDQTLEDKGKVVPVFFNLSPRHEGVWGSGGIVQLVLWHRH